MRTQAQAPRPFLCLLLAILAPSARASSGIDATTWHYAVDLGLAYTDGFARPSVMNLAESPDEAPDATRALGLRQFRLQLTLATVAGPAVHATLRPDALASTASETKEAREYETRACSPRDPESDRVGGCYRPAPSVKLLDAYRLVINPLSGLAGAIGVFSGLAKPRTTFEPLLGFGLETRLPAKFSALEISWRQVGSERQGFCTELYVLQGDEDRVEARADRRDSYDVAPVAKDPYYGGAARFGHAFEAVSVSLLGGYQDARAEGGKVNEVYGQAMLSLKASPIDHELRLDLDLRHARESWRVDGPKVEDRTQQSLEVSASYHATKQDRVLSSLAYGTSERPSASSEGGLLLTLTGYQLSLGVESEMGPGLAARLMMSEERRRAKTSDKEVGGFFDEDGERSTDRRIGIEIAYRLGGNA